MMLDDIGYDTGCLSRGHLHNDLLNSNCFCDSVSRLLLLLVKVGFDAGDGAESSFTSETSAASPEAKAIFKRIKSEGARVAGAKLTESL